jgi:hypothetical protein
MYEFHEFFALSFITTRIVLDYKGRYIFYDIWNSNYALFYNSILIPRSVNHFIWNRTVYSYKSLWTVNIIHTSNNIWAG